MTDITADRAALRDRIAAALYKRDHLPGRDPRWPKAIEADRKAFETLADAVLAVLPPPTDRTTALTAAERQFLTFALTLAQEQMFSRGDEFTDEDEAALERLRRMADETPAAEHRPSVSRWRVETLDNLAGEWAPGTGWPVRDLAAERYELMNAKAPKWKDGTPVTRRLVRETTTYTVEAEHGPAGARQDGAQP